MNRSGIGVGLLLLWMVGSGCLVAPPATGDEPSKVPGAPHLLPADTLLYLRVDNANELRADLQASSIGKMLGDPQLKPLANDMLAVASDILQRFSRGTSIPLDQMLAIPTGQVAVAVMPGTVSERSAGLVADSEDDESEEAIRRRIALRRQQQNAFSICFLVEAGENIESLMTMVDRVEESVLEEGFVRRESEIEHVNLVRWLPPRAGRSEMEYFVRDGTLVFGVGHRAAEAVLERWLEKNQQPTLAERAEFASVMSRCIGAEATRPQLTFFADASRLFERVVKRQSMAALFWPLLEQLGVNKLRGMGGSLFRGGEDFESIIHVHVLIDPPRDGLFGLLRPEDVETTPPTWVPADVSGYTTIHWNMEQTYENLVKVMTTFGQQNMLKDRLEGPIEEVLGVSFQDDLLPNLTGRYANCQWIEPPVKVNSQVQAHAFELTDAAMAQAALAKFHRQRPQDFSAETMSGVVVYFIQESARESFGGGSPFAGRGESGRGSLRRRPGSPRLSGAENESFADDAATREFRAGLRKPEPNVVILGDWAIYSDSRKFAELLIRTHQNTAAGLLSVPEYDLILSELGGKLDGEKPFLISFLKGADYVRQMYDLAQSPDTRRLLRARAAQDEIAGRIVDLLERDELPPFEEFELYFAPTGFFAYDEPGGIHIGMFTLRAE